MRICDPRVGRFMSVDPIAPNYPELAPYQFAGNAPIQAIDLDGNEATTAKIGGICYKGMCLNTAPYYEKRKPACSVLMIPSSILNLLAYLSRNPFSENTFST